MRSVKIIKIGNLAGIVLSRELLAKLGAGVGETVYVTETPDGICISADSPDFADKMDLAEQIVCQDHDILRALAK